MQKVAKLFLNGKSQAVRLPREFRFNGTEVWIRKDAETGDVILSARPNTWTGFFALRNSVPAKELEQFDPRPVPLAEERANPFAGWKE
jgi:antitoxin VapB